MGVQFNNIPADLRAPLFFAELNSGGTPFKDRSRGLMIGQKMASGQADANEAILVQDRQLGNMFGNGSMIAGMGRVARRNAPNAEIWYLPLDDDGSGVAASGSLTVAGAPVANPGTLAIYVAGTRVRIAIKISYSDTDIATKLAAEINKDASLPVTASSGGAVVTVTARHKGALGNTLAIDLGELTEEGPLGKELLTIGAMAGGSGDPDILAALAALGSDEFDWIAMPYPDAANLDHMRGFMSDVSGRWGPMSQLYGHAITAKKANYAAQQTLGAVRNDQHMTIIGANGIRTPVWEMAAAVAIICQKHLSHPPELSRPLQTLELIGVKGPLKNSEVFNKSELNTLYYDGISGYHVRRDGTVCIDHLITTYQTNEWGDPDATWLNVNTIAQAQYAIRFLRTEITRVHGRQGLADDGPDETLVPRGVATPKRIRTTIIHGYDKLVGDGVMENPDAFNRALIVERDTNDADRVNVDLRMDHVNQLRILAMAATSYLQRSSVTGNLQ